MPDKMQSPEWLRWLKIQIVGNYSNESALNEQSEKISIWASTYKTFLIS